MLVSMPPSAIQPALLNPIQVLSRMGVHTTIPALTPLRTASLDVFWKSCRQEESRLERTM